MNRETPAFGFLTVFGLLVAIALATNHAAPQRPSFSDQKSSPTVGVVGLADLLALRREPGLVLIDARPAVAFRNSRIGGAINVAPAAAKSLSSELSSQLRAASTIVIYCDSTSCGAAIAVAEFLSAQGIKHASIFAGGMSEWRLAGLEMESSK